MPRKHNKKGITYSGQRTTHDTDGLPGYPAIDLFADPGTPFRAPERGRIVRISGHPGDTSGQIYGQSIYFQGVSGRMYFITHLGSVRGKGRYDAGTIIGTISRWTGGSPHAHVGINDDNLKKAPDYAAIQTAGFWSGYGGGDQSGVPAAPAQNPQAPGGTPDQIESEPTAAPYDPTENTPDLPTTEFQELDPSQTWQVLANLPFSSPETQQWAARVKRHA